MRHETRSVTVRMRGLTNGEGGMSSPSPSTAHVLERTSVKFAVHEEREVNLTGQRCRAGLLQEQPTGVLPMSPSPRFFGKAIM